MLNDKYIEAKRIAALFDALGHYRRVLIFRALQKNAKSGLTFGDLATATKLSEANLAHHLRMMKKGGVVVSQTVGRHTFLSLNLGSLEQNLALLSLDIP